MSRLLKLAGALGVVALALTACAPTPSDSGTSTDGGDTSTGDSGTVVTDFDITQLCGDDEIQIALTDGAAGHTWRKIVLAEFQSEAAKCPNITDVFYADAGNDPQKAAADIAGFVAQGVDIIVSLPDHGDAMIPAFREAFNEGVTMIPYYNAIGGTPGVDYTESVIADTFSYGKEMGEWAAANVESGNVIVLGGIASCTSCELMYDGVKEALEGTDLTLIGDSHVATDYNPETAERTVNGLLSQYGDIDVIIGDYGVIAEAALNSFRTAGKPLPAVAISSGQNSVYCTWWDDEEAGNAGAFAEWGEATQLVRAALRRGMAAYNGIEYSEPTKIIYPVVIDTPQGTNPPTCDTSLPPDTDMFSGLTEEELRAAIS
jgi:ribose transport system substrate-binding protein